jgi:TPP-dependent pyruvate/acetoin dehydrogenase alpha subunit
MAWCAAEVDRALKAAQNTPPPGPETLFDHVYADPPARLLEQRKQWAAAAENGG